MFAYKGSLENETKEIIQYYHNQLQFLSPPINHIEREYGLIRRSRVDFLGETDTKYILIECKGVVKDTHIGQILRYKDLLLEEIENKKQIEAILIGSKIEKNVISAIKGVTTDLKLIHWDKNLHFNDKGAFIDKVIYHFSSPLNGFQDTFLEIKIDSESPWKYIQDLSFEFDRINFSDIDSICQKLKEEHITLQAEREILVTDYKKKILEIDETERKMRLEQNRFSEMLKEEYEGKISKKEEEIKIKEERLDDRYKEYIERVDDLKHQEYVWTKEQRRELNLDFRDTFRELRVLLSSIHEERRLLEETTKKLGIKYHNSKTLKSFQKSLIKHL